MPSELKMGTVVMARHPSLENPIGRGWYLGFFDGIACVVLLETGQLINADGVELKLPEKDRPRATMAVAENARLYRGYGADSLVATNERLEGGDLIEIVGVDCRYYGANDIPVVAFQKAGGQQRYVSLDALVLLWHEWQRPEFPALSKPIKPDIPSLAA